MPRVIEKTSCRVPLDGGAIFKYSYMPTWKLDYLLNGKRLRVTLSPDKREALRLANKLLDEKRNIEGTSRRSVAEVTLREVVDSYLLMRRSKLPPDLRNTPREYRSYRIDEDRLNMILSLLPVEMIAKLQKKMCHAFIDKIMTEKSRTNKTKLIGRTTAGKPVRLLIAALRYGASIDLCNNPLDGMEIAEAKGTEIRKSRRAMTAVEYQRFITAAVARDERLSKAIADRIPQTPAYMALYEAGRRREEIELLEWPSVHLDGDSPTWEFWNTKGSKLAKGTASNEPERYAIPPKLVPILQSLNSLHERRLDRKVSAGDRVFLSPMGRPLHGDNLRNDFYEILIAADIPRFDHRGRSLDLHAARTTVYARGAAAGIPADQMMTFVGHKDIRTAMRHYRDPDCLDTQRIAAKLAGITTPTRN